MYAVLGAGYLRTARLVVLEQSGLRNRARNLADERYTLFYQQFLKLYAVTTGTLVILGLSSFIEGMLMYFTNDPALLNYGSIPALAGIAALLINIFISGCIASDLKTCIAKRNTPQWPRSPTPASQNDATIHVATIQSPEGGSPPPYSQITIEPKFDGLPPSYHEVVVAESRRPGSTEPEIDGSTVPEPTFIVISSVDGSELRTVTPTGASNQPDVAHFI